MKTIGNILWVIFGGFILAVMWFICALLCCCTIIGIPVGVQCFKFAGFVLWPFGKTIQYSNNAGSFILNVLWVLLFGWELALASVAIGIIWCITIIGIPFGIQSIKFAQLAFFPFGSRVI